MKQAFLHFQFYLITWMSKNKDRWPRYLVLTACAGCALFLASAMLTAVHPYGSEIAQNALIGVGLFINAALAAISVLLIVAAFAWQFGKGISIEFITPGNLLPSGWQEPDISPDILIVSRPGETREETKARFELARESASPSQWVVVIPYQHPAGIIMESPMRVRDFVRTSPPFQSEDWTPEQRVCPPNTFFVNETEREYREYINRFAAYFREWSARVKFHGETNNAVKLEILRAAVALLFVLFSVALPAANREDLQRAIGKNIREIPASGAQVEFMFANGKTHFRTGDGKRNYIQLLEGLPGGFRYPAAAFIAVTKNGELVAKADAAGEVATTKEAAMRPYSQAVEVPSMEIPDSARMAEAADRAKVQILELSEQAKKASAPWWEVVMFAFWQAFPFLILLGALSWFAAKVFASEGMYEAHKYARYSFAMLATAAGGVLLVNMLLAAISAGAGPFPLTVIAVVETYIAYRVVSALVPDFRPSSGNAPMRHRGGDDNPTLYLPK